MSSAPTGEVFHLVLSKPYHCDDEGYLHEYTDLALMAR